MDETTNLGDSSPPAFIQGEPQGTADLGPVETYGSGAGEDMGVAAQRAQVEETRAEMSGTIDAIQQKLSPENLAQQAKETVRDATIGKVEDALNTATDTVQQAASAAEDTAASVGSTLIETIKQNPVPAALAGLGLGWLIMEARKSSSQPSARNYSGPYGGVYTGYTRGEGYSPYPGMPYTPQAGEYGNQSQGMVGQAVDGAQQTAGQVVDTAQQAAGQVASTVQYGAQQATSTFQQMLQERPLAVGAGAIAVGLAIGLAIPETPQENQLMGQARETVVSKVEQAAADASQKVEQKVEQAMGSASQSGSGQSSKSSSSGA